VSVKKQFAQKKETPYCYTLRHTVESKQSIKLKSGMISLSN